MALLDRMEYDVNTGCWNATGCARNKKGYGNACYMGKRMAAHRLAAHLWLRMPLDDPRMVLHKCDNPRCFNPKHLFLGTQKDNIQDCLSKGRQRQQKKTHCPSGHPYTQENIYYVTFKKGKRIGRTERHCKICYRAHSRNYTKRKGELQFLKAEAPTGNH